MVTPDQPLITRKEAAKFLSQLGYAMTSKYLTELAYRKKGPPYFQVNGYNVRYTKKDLEEWLHANMKRIEYK